MFCVNRKAVCLQGLRTGTVCCGTSMASFMDHMDHMSVSHFVTKTISTPRVFIVALGAHLVALNN